MNTDLEDLLQSLERGRILPVADAARAMIDIAEGRAPAPEFVRFLQAYNRRPPAAHEIAAFVEVLRARMIRVNAPAENTLCNCGTGGDG
ncbi:MAG: anthranilate phosphoribosyltransferase, partial [Planctomycetota bacterium]